MKPIFSKSFLTFFILFICILFHFKVNAQRVNTASNSLSSSKTSSLSIADISVFEGNSGSPSATFTVKLLPASGQTVTVNYASANGTVIFGTDYISTNGSLTFYSGDTIKTVSVVVNGDIYFEENETLYVNISNAVNAILLTKEISEVGGEIPESERVFREFFNLLNAKTEEEIRKVCEAVGDTISEEIKIQLEEAMKKSASILTVLPEETESFTFTPVIYSVP
ncbi:MAG: hypothetical protein FJ218_01185 [Ignavibacteria bacterium]|nr:hypothetical protein [Ignavibacteria bacterium]